MSASANNFAPFDRDCAILGAGAIGCLLAAQLAAAGMMPILLLRDRERLQRYRAAGGYTIALRGQQQLWRLPAEAVQCEGAPLRRVLIATKAQVAAVALASLRARLRADSEVLLVVNGLGIADTLRPMLPDGATLIVGTTTEGAYRQDETHIVHAGQGQTTLGGSSEPPSWLQQARGRGLRWHWDADIDQLLWRKLAINCAINPLAALRGCPNGELLANPALHAELEALLPEIAAVLQHEGYPTLASGLATDVRRVIAGTAANRCSMLQDLARGQTTEIEAITGYLLASARRHGLALPRNHDLYTAIKARTGQLTNSKVP